MVLAYLDQLVGVALNDTGCPAPMLRPPVHPDQNDASISFLQESFRAARLSRQLLEGIGHTQVGKGMSSLVHLCMWQPGAVACSLPWLGCQSPILQSFPCSGPSVASGSLVPWPGVKQTSPTEGELGPRPVPDPGDIPLHNVWEPILWLMIGWAQTSGASGSGE